MHLAASNTAYLQWLILTHVEVYGIGLVRALTRGNYYSFGDCGTGCLLTDAVYKLNASVIRTVGETAYDARWLRSSL